MKEFYEALINDITAQQNKIIENQLLELEFFIDEEFIKANLTFIEGDKFKHLFYHYGLPTQKRIISIQKMPDIYFGDNKFKAELKYY